MKADKIVVRLNAWWKAHPVVRKPINTFWQTYVAFLLAGLGPVLSSLLQTHDLKVAQTALAGLVVSAGAAAFSAVKTYLVETLKEKTA